MTERQNGEFFNPEVDRKFSVDNVDTGFGYNKRRMDEKTDELVRLAREAQEVDKDFQFIKNNESVVSDEKIDGTVDRMFEVDREIDRVLTGNIPRKEVQSFDEKKINDGVVEEKTFWEKFQERVIESKVFKRVGSLIVAAATMFQLGSAMPVRADESTPAPADPSATHSAEADENKTEDDFPTTIEGYTPAPGNPLETEPYISDAYDIYKEEVSFNREFLKENECQPENLECCARGIYAIKNCVHGFRDGAFDWPEKTILSNYVTVEDMVEFGKNGKCKLSDGTELKGIRDNNGKLIFFYVGESDYNIGVDTIEKAILSWDPDRQRFLEYIEGNNVAFFFQNKANKSMGVVTKFGYGILYFNYGKADKKAGGKKETYSNSVKKILGNEVMANRLRIIEGNDLEYVSDSPLLKLELAIDATEYLIKKEGGKFYKSMLKEYNAMLKDYKKRYPAVGDIDSLVVEIKKNNLVIPFGADSWEEIDKVVG